MSEAPVPTHVGVVGEVLTADCAGELITDGSGGGGPRGTETTRLGPVSFQRRTAGVTSVTCKE